MASRKFVTMTISSHTPRLNITTHPNSSTCLFLAPGGQLQGARKFQARSVSQYARVWNFRNDAADATRELKTVGPGTAGPREASEEVSAFSSRAWTTILQSLWTRTNSTKCCSRPKNDTSVDTPAQTEVHKPSPLNTKTPSEDGVFCAKRKLWDHRRKAGGLGMSIAGLVGPAGV